MTTLLELEFAEIIKDPEEIEIILSTVANTTVEKQARKDINSGAAIVKIVSPNFYRLQELGNNLFFSDVSKIMKDEFGASYKDFWYLTATLPKKPVEPAVFVLLKKNM